MKNYLSLGEFKKLDIANDVLSSTLFESTEKLAKEVSEFYPATIVFDVYEHEGKKHYNNMLIQLENDLCPLYIWYYNYRKRYSVFCPAISSFENVEGSTATRLLNEIDAPVTMGKLSTKKITDWINYYNLGYSKAVELDKANKAKKDAFLKSLEGENVRWIKDGKNGEIVKNGIEFSFCIQTEYVTKKIQIYYEVPNSLESFKALSDNKYLSKK